MKTTPVRCATCQDLGRNRDAVALVLDRILIVTGRERYEFYTYCEEHIPDTEFVLRFYQKVKRLTDGRK